MKTLLYVVLLISSISFFSACSSSPDLTESQAMDKYQAVAVLDQSMLSAKKDRLSFWAPIAYEKTAKALEEAKSLAVADEPSADAVALKGQQHFNAGQAQAAKARHLFSEVDHARSKAIGHGSMSSAPAKMTEIDNDFRELAIMLEKGNDVDAKVGRPDLVARYQQLELASVKKATIADAVAALDNAKQRKADKYAPKTYASAQKNLKLASSAIDSDLSNQGEAQDYAAKAIWQAQRSASISDTAQEFNRNDYEMEDIVLWHQAQVGKAVSPLDSYIPFNLSDNDVMASVADSVQEIVNERNQMAAAMDAQQQNYAQQLSMRQTELSAMETQIKASDQQRAANRENLAKVQKLFTGEEATVYLQNDNVLIRAHGFWFPSGGSEIDSRNFPLLKKISAAVNDFPNSKVVVSGHTDSTGSEVTNLKLSKERAKKVEAFLAELGGVAAARLSYEGYGQSKPVGNNATSKGREQNRRVEVLIINQ